MRVVLEKLAGWWTNGLLVMVITVGTVGLSATPALATPNWSVAVSSSNPFGGMSFARESEFDHYTITVTNTGTTPSSGAVVMSDQLPKGITLGAKEQFQTHLEEFSGVGWACEATVDATIANCTHAGAIAAGEASTITMQVYVNDQATNPSVNAASVSGGGSSPIVTTVSYPTTITPAVQFGIESFTTSVTEELGNQLTQAGGHPFTASTEFILNTTPSREEEGSLQTAGGSAKEVDAELPAGFVGDPQNATQCPLYLFVNHACPTGSAVGYMGISVAGKIVDGSRVFEPLNPVGSLSPKGAVELSSLVYDLVPPPGHPAAFGFLLLNASNFILYATVRSDGDYGVTVGGPIAQTPIAAAARVTFCEDGASKIESLGSVKYECNAVTSNARPFVTNPVNCSAGPLTTTLVTDPWNEPSDYVSATATSPAVTGCGLLKFEPKIELEPVTRQADEPTAMQFDLEVPQTNEASKLATPELKNSKVTLPPGMTVSPSAADGLRGCTDEQFGLHSGVPGHCPEAAQIATAEVFTPLLEKEVPSKQEREEGVVTAAVQGKVFLGQPLCGGEGQEACSEADATNGRLYRLFIEAEDVKNRGENGESPAIVKLAGTVSANPSTGQLTATFDNNPQLPFEELKLKFHGGDRAPLATPPTCGEATTTSDLTPWSAPETPDATPTTGFPVSYNGAGEACPGNLPLNPSFAAGMENATAGAFSNFTLTFSRPQRAHESEERSEQDFSSIQVHMPPGLVGMLSKVPLCSEPQAAAGTCGPESEIGTTTVGAGPGSHPFQVGGRVYLTGPYNGAPFGLSIVVPAVAGPFNLGNVVVRAAINVDPHTTALTITSGPLPQIIDGVLLRLHTINVQVTRPEFTFNPTNCAAQSISATIAGAQGGSASVSSPFAAGGCANLPFSPSFAASTQGQTSKADGASLVVKVSQNPGEANIHKVDLTLPLALPARLTTLQQACTEAQFNANPAGCPAASDIGIATAHTPVLNVPLTGPAFLVSHGGAAFPDVEFVLQGDERGGNVEVVLDGATDIKKGITYSKFETVPDDPISSFETILPEGPHSVLAANANLCTAPLAMPTTIEGQNGKVVTQQTQIAVTGCAPVKPVVKIAKTKVKGETVTLSVIVPGKGRLSVSGTGLHTVRHSVSKAGTYTLKTGLTTSEKKKLKHKKKMKLKVRVGYVPSAGGSSSATVSLTVKA